MFYFNMKAKSCEKQGISYNPPFGLYTVMSGSMVPNINVYDVVLTKEEKDLSKIKVGDIITFISTWDATYGFTITHRVVSISKTEDGEYQFTTKGDFNQEADGAYVTQDNLVGKVVLRIPQLGRVQFFLASKMGWFMIVFIPALGIIIYDVLKIFKLFKIKEKIEVVKDVKSADEIFFGDELLENRSLSDDKLTQTLKVDIIEDKTIEIPNVKGETMPAVNEKPVNLKTPELLHRPLKTREEMLEEREEKIENKEAVIQESPKRERKLLTKRKKL